MINLLFNSQHLSRKIFSFKLYDKNVPFIVFAVTGTCRVGNSSKFQPVLTTVYFYYPIHIRYCNMIQNKPALPNY